MEDELRIVFRARGFWELSHEIAYFSVGVFNLFVSEKSSRQLTTVYKQHEQLKQRVHEQHFREVEHGTFTSLVFSATMVFLLVVTLKRLSLIIFIKCHKPYNIMMWWIYVLNSYSLLRSVILCPRGSRVHYHRPVSVVNTDFTLATSEGRIAI